MPNSTESILDYEVEIANLREEDTFYLPAETGNYSVAGFEMVLNRKVAHYMITYYLPSSLFVVVSWASFLIPSDDIQVKMKNPDLLDAKNVFFFRAGWLCW